jgi:hypothetical protein
MVPQLINNSQYFMDSEMLLSWDLIFPLWYSIKFTALWDMTPCTLLNTYQTVRRHTEYDRNPVHYRFRKDPPLAPILRHTTPVQLWTSYQTIKHTVWAEFIDFKYYIWRYIHCSAKVLHSVSLRTRLQHQARNDTSLGRVATNKD